MDVEAIRTPRIYCPNVSCAHHLVAPGEVTSRTRFKRFLKIGKRFRKSSPESVQRYRCVKCGKRFSSTIGSLDYRNRKLGLNRAIFFSFVDGLSNRQISRNLGVDETLVRNRLRKLSQQSLLHHSLRARGHQITEVICYDGVENFAKSQYEPNNINQAIGMDSLFIYDFNFSPLNRKGRMSDRQKLKKAKLEESLGKFPRDAIRKSSGLIFSRLAKRVCSPSRLCIASDEHFQYRRAIRQDLKRQRIEIDHQTISSKAPRTYRHILFPVNHADLLLRQHVKAFARETISFSKTHAAMVRKYAIFMAWKNYIRPQFTKAHKSNPLSNTRTPAVAAGIVPKPLRFRDFFGTRLLKSQIPMCPEWEEYFDGQISNLREAA